LKLRIELLFSCHLQLHNSPVDCARELSRPSKDFVSPLVRNEKNLGFGFQLFMGDVIHEWDRFRPFWLRLLGPGPQMHYGSISLKLLVETGLK